MKHFGWSTFVVGLMLSSVVAIAFALNEEQWDGDTGGDDLVFPGGVLIDNVTLPSNLGDDIGTSKVSTIGTGSVTIFNRTRSGLALSFPGGTDISVTREWDSESPTNLWWEGVLSAPQPGENPIYNGDNIYFDKDGLHPNSSIHVVSTFGMGLSNEEYKFSNPATFNFTGINEAPGKKIWYAIKETVPPGEADEAEWEILEGNFCVVKSGGICTVELDALNAITFVREIFGQCPRTEGSDTTIKNGLTSGVPWCDVSCDRGYEIDYAEMKCVAKEGFINEELLPEEPEVVEEVYMEDEGVFVPPGYFRYTGSGEQYKKTSTNGLVGEDRLRVQRTNAAVRKTIGDDQPEEVEVVDTTKDSFMDYLWRVRDFFGEHSNVVTVSEEVETGEMMEEGMEESEVHSSAPLLPSTGPGIFVGLAAVGLGLMVIGGRRRH
ncbi:hypothetical protein K9M41_02035 [Candidatus Gracilibacteria bacterium]|nr:hypothetical protein [Candidatus Gracilibacteria bacterium]